MTILRLGGPPRSLQEGRWLLRDNRQCALGPQGSRVGHTHPPPPGTPTPNPAPSETPSSQTGRPRTGVFPSPEVPSYPLPIVGVSNLLPGVALGVGEEGASSPCLLLTSAIPTVTYQGPHQNSLE